jgi:hypothetical protein
VPPLDDELELELVLELLLVLDELLPDVEPDALVLPDEPKLLDPPVAPELVEDVLVDPPVAPELVDVEAPLEVEEVELEPPWLDEPP